MSVILYKNGGSQKIEPELMDAEIAAGWSLSPNPDPPEAVEKPVEPVKETYDVRQAAKRAGIKNWHNKRVDRLITELADVT